MPLILKGVQCWEDALQAYDAGLAGVVLSNHGGRQLDFARSGVEVLAETVRELGARRSLSFPNDKFQLFVDGGVRRANDVLKAVALGATAVGVGRPFLYAFSAYGFEGVDHALGILHDEFEMNMRLIGARSLKEIGPQMVDASSLTSHIVPVPGDRLFDSNCAWWCLLNRNFGRHWADWSCIQTRACSMPACGTSSRSFEDSIFFRLDASMAAHGKLNA